MIPDNNSHHEYETVFLLQSDCNSADEEEKQCACDSSVISQHEASSESARKKLIFAAILSVVFMVIELTGGYLSGSLAIMSDAAHLVTDSLTFVIGVFGITWGAREQNSKMNFGYKRVEVLCAIISIMGIWVLTLFLLYFAVQRLLNLDKFEINTDMMLIVSLLGVFVNIVMASILHGGSCQIFQHNHSHGNDSLNHHHHRHEKRSSGDDEMKKHPIDDNGSLMTTQSECKSENINVQAAFLHVLGDFIQSIGVIIAAVIIKFYPQAKVVDPLITFLFSIIVVCTTLKIFKKSTRILLEGIPEHVSNDEISNDLENLAGVVSIHDLKVWSLSNEVHAMTVHIVIKDLESYQNTLKQATDIMKAKYKLNHVTIQIEVK